MKKWTISELLDKTASTGPEPGGGGATGIGAALGLSLNLMALETTAKSYENSKRRLSKKEDAPDKEAKLEEYDRHLVSLAVMKEELLAKRERIIELAEEDGQSFQGVLDAMKMDKKDPQRAEAIEAGLVEAIELPKRLLKELVEVYSWQIHLYRVSKKTIMNDNFAGSHLLLAAIETMCDNIWVNVEMLKGKAQKDRQLASYHEIRHEIDEISQAIAAYRKDFWPDREAGRED